MANINGFKKPKGYRTGQLLYNFLSWIALNKPNEEIFYIPDIRLNELYEQYLLEIGAIQS